MKLRIAALALAPLALFTLSFATPSAQERGGEQKSVLTGKMREINGILRQVGKSLEDEASAEANAAAVLRLQQLALEAKKETPMLVGAMGAEEQAEAMIGYRMQMNVLLRGALDLEDALLQRDAKKAEKAMAALDEAKADGHGEYKGRGR